MKQFKIYENEVTKQVEAVKVGWCWPAFFFGFIYALVKKSWALAGIMFVVGLVLQFVLAFVLAFIVLSINSDVNPESLEFGLRFWSNILVGIIWGLKFNAFYENSLVKQMFKLKETLPAGNANMAVMTYMNKK